MKLHFYQQLTNAQKELELLTDHCIIYNSSIKLYAIVQKDAVKEFETWQEVENYTVPQQ